MNQSATAVCCPPFDPAPWNETLVSFEGKWFLQDHVVSLFHIPLNFGGVMTRCMRLIEAHQAQSQEQIVLSDESSLWGAEVYVLVNKEIPGAKMTRIPGQFRSKVFTGEFSQMGRFIQEMKNYVAVLGKSLGNLLFYYPLCPKCAKKYGGNKVVILNPE